MSEDDLAAGVLDLLQIYKSQTDSAIRAYLPDREPREHLYDLVRDYPARGGKGLRAGLCLSTCVAFGGSVDLALRSAAALEMFHNGFLIHDDIEDGSEQRRGLPTLHAAHGMPLALNAGDAMFVLSIRPLMESLPQLGPGLTWLVLAEIEHMVRESVEGQAIELGWVRESRDDLEDADYFRMCLKKTCWYTTMHPCRIGALIGAAGSVPPDRFNSFCYFLGLAFQIQDDLLNLLGEAKKYGKEIGGDILEGKRTLMLLHLQRNLPPGQKAWLADYLSQSRCHRRQSDMAEILELMERHGSLEHARRTARFFAGAALEGFNGVYGDLPETRDRAFIRDIVLYMIERDL